MLVHIDGSAHQWFCDHRWYDLIVVMDDATSERNLGLIEHYNNQISGRYEIRDEAGLKDYLEQHLT